MDITKAKDQMVKVFGKGIVIVPSDSEVFDNCICSTGFAGLDKAMGTLGIPRERIIEVYGPEASGKTTLTLHLAAAVQDAGGSVSFIDVEHALDTNYARNIGVDVDNLLISQPDYGEQGIDLAVKLLMEQKVDPTSPHLIIIDSVDALVPKKEIDCDFDIEYDADGKKKNKSGGGLGLRARLMSDACRRITARLKGTNASVIFINQIRSKIGVMFGSPETTSGGNALKFYASMRFDIRATGREKRGDEIIGNTFRVRVVKNKCAPPFKDYNGLNIHGKGFSRHWDMFTSLQDKGKITKKGSWMYLEGTDDKFQGYNGFLTYIEDEENLLHCESLLE